MKQEFKTHLALDKRTVELNQIAQLKILLNKSLNENKKIYEQIRTNDPKFEHHLYQPKSSQGSDTFFMKALILKQIDHVMDEKDELLKKHEKIKFKQKGKQSEENEIMKNGNHFTFLRSTWTKFPKQQTECPEKIDNLNKIVSIIRHNIKEITLNESNNMKNLENKSESTYSTEAFMLEKQRQKGEVMKMKNQDLLSFCAELQQLLIQKDEKIRLLEFRLEQMQVELKGKEELSKANELKYIEVEEIKNSLMEKVSRLTNSKQSSVVYEGVGSEKFVIMIQSEEECQNQNQNHTYKSLKEVIEFLNGQSPASINPELDDSSVIPELKLENNLCRMGMVSETQRKNKAEKFIPMRTQRSFLNRTSTLQITRHSEPEQEEPLNEKKFCRKIDEQAKTSRKNSRMKNSNFLISNQMANQPKLNE